MGPEPLLSVIIPVYNEKESLEAVIEAVRNAPFSKEITVVDDGSTDGTAGVLSKILERYPDIVLVRHEANCGKGEAVRTAIGRVRGELVIIQDADLEYDPADYEKLIKAFEDPNIQVVYGSRFLSGKQITDPFQYFANRVITALGNWLFHSRLTDLETCYKMFRRDLLKSFDLRSSGFEIEVELTASSLKAGVAIAEVPIRYRGRNYQQGKKITWWDGVIALIMLLRHKFF